MPAGQTYALCCLAELFRLRPDLFSETPCCAYWELEGPQCPRAIPLPTCGVHRQGLAFLMGGKIFPPASARPLTFSLRRGPQGSLARRRLESGRTLVNSALLRAA